jgi:Polyketide cyclase / dehydrase and lipid transport
MTTTIELEQSIAAPMDRCWEHLRDLARHTTWMKDAIAIEFLGEQTQGVGTTMQCKTRIGPFTTDDVMDVTLWEEGHQIGVAHRGVVTGEGVFTLSAQGSATTFAWRESLRFGWLLGGPIGEVIAKPIMKRIWKANLQRFAGIVEGA